MQEHPENPEPLDFHLGVAGPPAGPFPAIRSNSRGSFELGQLRSLKEVTGRCPLGMTFNPRFSYTPPPVCSVGVPGTGPPVACWARICYTSTIIAYRVPVRGRSRGGSHPEMLALSSPPQGAERAIFIFLSGAQAMAKRNDTGLWNRLAEMRRLEQRVETSLRRQEETRRHTPEISAQLGSIRGNALRHLRRLEEFTGWPGPEESPAPEWPGPEEGEPLQRDLGEDLALVSRTAGGYLMLLTAARALEESDLAELAEQHLRDYTEGAVRILGVIPLVVVQSLRAEGAAVRVETVPSVARTAAEIWRSQVEPLASM